MSMAVYLGGHYTRSNVEMSCRQPLKASHPAPFTPHTITLQYSTDGVIMFVFDQACSDCGTGTKCHQPQIAEFESAGSGLGTSITEHSSVKTCRGIGICLACRLGDGLAVSADRWTTVFGDEPLASARLLALDGRKANQYWHQLMRIMCQFRRQFPTDCSCRCS